MADNLISELEKRAQDKFISKAVKGDLVIYLNALPFLIKSDFSFPAKYPDRHTDVPSICKHLYNNLQ